MDVVYWMWIANALLAGAVVGLCLVKAYWKHLIAARDARVAGLMLLCASIAWGSHARRDEDFTPRILVLHVGLWLCLYGMSRTALGESPQEHTGK